MVKNLSYAGYAAEPSDYECEDGQLSASINLINEDRQLKPIFSPKTICDIGDGEEIVFVHKTSVYTHYIKLSADKCCLWFIDSSDMENPKLINIFGNTIYKVNAVGNTLIAVCGDGLHYILWKDGKYIHLGQKPPFIRLSFGVSENHAATYDRGTIETTDPSKEYMSAWRALPYKASDCMEVNSTKKSVVFKNYVDEIQSSIWALINQTNAFISKQGHFYAPFFVRYCYRMYDGTQWMHSAPVFLPVSMPRTYDIEVPNVFTSNRDGVISNILNKFNATEEQGGEKDFTIDSLCFRYRPANVALTMECKTPSSLIELQAKWGDIVKSIDVFVSLPITRELNGEKISTASIAKKMFHLSPNDISLKTYGWHIGNDSNSVNDVVCDIPMLPEDAYLSKIKNTTALFKVCSWNLAEVNSSKWGTYNIQEVPIDKSVLPTLATQEAMKDDYKHHNILFPAFNDNGECITSLFNYNGRLNVSGVKERLFGGFGAEILPLSTSLFASSGSVQVQDIFVYLNTEDGEKIVRASTEPGFSSFVINPALLYNCPLFYPDSRAVRMKLRIGNDYYAMAMDSCPMLNGSMTRGGVMKDLETHFSTESATDLTTDNIVDVGNKLYTSDINNPFYFPVTGINTVGTGKIIGVTAAVKALSEGQFGQFPLYAFTTDGVWAMEVSSNGTYSAKQPITRDVCVNPASITQIDDAVLFATDRGIMVIQGSKTTCITDVLNTEVPFDYTLLQGWSKLSEAIGGNDVKIRPFISFLSGCRVIYCYTKQRIIVCNPLYGYAYVYSLKSKQWGMMASSLRGGINSYPTAEAMTTDNELVSLDSSDEKESRGVYVTRPLKFGLSDIHKTISSIIQRGHFAKGDVNTVLYASNDLYNWTLVWSSVDHYLRGFSGTPYKYFRIAGATKFTDGKSLYGATIEEKERLTNQTR